LLCFASGHVHSFTQMVLLAWLEHPMHAGASMSIYWRSDA
jgi:hypothetical protein